MKASRYTLTTLKEIPADAEIASHRLLLRAGFIRKLASGIYTWMPIGFRVLKKVEAIIREEMNRSGAQELLMPFVQPAELWQESGRWQKYDEGLLLKFTDRSQRDFCFGPTHEEVITDIARNELRSHRQLPVNWYQIQTKFRDETRPRFGVLRAREFVMKDAYSFHIDAASLDETFQSMHRAYGRILERMRLDYRPVLADSGSIGGNDSVEFHVLADSGEDKLAFSTESDYAANLEKAEALAPEKSTAAALPVEEVSTPNAKTIEAVSAFLGIAANQTVKTLIVKGTDTPLVAIILRGDHQLSPVKAEKLAQVAAPLSMASDEAIQSATGCLPGSLGPTHLDMPVIVDRDADALTNFVCGANKDGYHLINVNWGRDATATTVVDIREVVEGDRSPDGKGVLQFKRGIEVGHIFKLGDKYTKPMNATVLDQNGKAVTMVMGCYGMGVSRLVGAIIEQYHDDKGMIWPAIVAPFHVVIIPINAYKSVEVAELTERLYDQMLDLGIEVLLDDRDSQRPGAKFADAELIGIPHRIVVGERGLKTATVEYVHRETGQSEDLPIEGLVEQLMARIAQDLD